MYKAQPKKASPTKAQPKKASPKKPAVRVKDNPYMAEGMKQLKNYC